MPNAPTSGSFIPKKNTGKPVASAAGRYIGLFGYVSYITFFGSLFLALGMFLLSQYVSGIRSDREADLVSIRAEFSDQELARVVGFDNYLNSARQIFDQSYSLAPILEAFEQSVAQPVLFNSITMEATGSMLVFEVTAQADSFGATLFQRNVFADIPMLEAITVNDVRLVRGPDGSLTRFSQGSATTGSAASVLSSLEVVETINFVLELNVARTDLEFNPTPVTNIPSPTAQVVPFAEDTDDGDQDGEVIDDIE